MVKKTRNNKNFDGKLVALKAGINKKPSATLTKLKNGSPLNDVSLYVSKLAKIPTINDIALSFPVPRSSESLKFGKRIAYFNLDRELYWSASVVRVYQDLINLFIRYKNQFEAALITGKYKTGIEILDTIDRTCGYSLWSIENRIAILQESEGLEKQKEFTYNITKNDKYPLAVRFLTHYWSNRAEKNISWYKFDITVNDFVERNADNAYGLADYTIYKLNFYDHLTPEADYGKILCQESNSSVIDRYLTLLTILELSYFKNKFNNNNAKHKIIDLLSKIDDQRLNLLRAIYGLNLPEINLYKCIEVFDYYAVGDYEKCCIAAEKHLQEDAINFDFIEVYLKSVYKTKNDSYFSVTDTLQKTILANLYNVMVKNDSCYDSYSSLIKIVQVYSSHYWSPILVSYLLKYYSEDDEYSNSIFVKLGTIRKCVGNPKLVHILPIEIRNIYRQNLAATFPLSITVNTYFQEIDFDRSSSIREDQNQNCVAKKLLANKSYQLACDFFKNVINSEDYILRQSSLRGLSRCYIEMNKLEYAVNLIVDAYLANENIYTVLPVSQIVKILGKTSPRGLEGNINLPIFYFIYHKHMSNDKDYMLSESCEDFFAYYGATRPTNLVNTTFDEIQNNKKIFFLKNICTFDVMDSSVAFTSTEDVERERIFVCQLLAQIDHGCDKIYSEEIKKITEKLHLSKLVRHIQQSKIYVNIDGLKKIIDKPLRESYGRYLSLLNKLTVQGEVGYIIESSEDGSELSFPVNEINNLFANMIIEIRNKFVSSNEYGLDGYLSVGIRHGILSGQIRGLLEHANLVSQKDVKTGHYRDLEYWNNMYGHLNDKTKNIINNKLKEFSRNIDEIIDELNNKFIRIKTETNEFTEGLFDFIVTIGEYESLQEVILKETTFDDFVDKVTELLWNKLDKSLYNIQTVFQVVIKDRICYLFDTLLQQLNDIILENSLSELSTVITTSSTSTLYEIDRISSWFTRSKAEYSSEFSCDVPFQIASEIIKNIHPSKKFEPFVEFDKEIVFQGKHIVSLTNVIYLVYDNIVKHSTRTNIVPQSSININVKDGFMYVVTSNDIDETVDIKQEKCKLLMIKDSFSHTKSVEKAGFEHGSGLYKIAKILAIDLSSDPDITFNISDERVFKLEAKLPSHGIIV